MYVYVYVLLWMVLNNWRWCFVHTVPPLSICSSPSSSLPLSLTFSSSLFCFSLSLPLPSLLPISLVGECGLWCEAESRWLSSSRQEGKVPDKETEFLAIKTPFVLCAHSSLLTILTSHLNSANLCHSYCLCVIFCFNVIIAHHAYQAWIMLIALCVQIIIIYFSINLYACTYFGPIICIIL